MVRVQQVEVISGSSPKRRSAKAFFVLFGRGIKCALLVLLSAVIWHLVGDGAGKAKLHGALLTPLAAVLAIQEYLFFQARGRMGEALKAPAIQVCDLSQLLDRIVKLKSYTDSLWFVSVPAKALALLIGPTLFLGGWPQTVLTFKGYAVTGDSLLATLGWLGLLIGLDCTWRTFRVFKHVDNRLMELEVEARQIAARNQEAAEFKITPVKDPAEKYPRV